MQDSNLSIHKYLVCEGSRSHLKRNLKNEIRRNFGVAYLHMHLSLLYSDIVESAELHFNIVSCFSDFIYVLNHFTLSMFINNYMNMKDIIKN